VREAVGDEIELLFDVHTRLDLADVVWLCREIEPCRTHWGRFPALLAFS
jgi:L-alanine-DL-glutamate epimerase-like enolase superfamily enzyme